MSSGATGREWEWEEGDPQCIIMCYSEAELDRVQKGGRLDQRCLGKEGFRCISVFQDPTQWVGTDMGSLQVGMMFGGFPGGSVVKNLPAMQETPVPSLGGEDPLEEGMATHSGMLMLAWRIP